MNVGKTFAEVTGQGGDMLLNPIRQAVKQDFENLEAFALHLVLAEAAWRQKKRMALKTVGKLLTADMRKQIGQYQDAAGNYAQWADLTEATEDEKARLGAPPDAPLLRFGDLQNSFRSEVPNDDELIAGSTDPVMEYHEFGTSKMPPRSVVGPALYKHIDKVREILAFAILDTVIGGQRIGYRFDAENGGIAVPGKGTSE